MLRGNWIDSSFSYTSLLLFLHGISIFLRILSAHFVPSKAYMQPASPFCFQSWTHKPLTFDPLASYDRPWHVVSFSCSCACIPHTRRHDWYTGLCISVQFNASSSSKEWDSSQKDLSSLNNSSFICTVMLPSFLPGLWLLKKACAKALKQYWHLVHIQNFYLIKGKVKS